MKTVKQSQAVEPTIPTFPMDSGRY